MKQAPKSAPKSTYVRPRLVVYGSLKDVTRGGSDGDYLDDDFDTGTAKGKLTFS